MYLAAYILLLLALLCALGGAGMGVAQLWQGRDADLGWLERANLVTAGCFVVSSGILMYALITGDFSLEYVANYTDSLLSLFYKITAFWAGQAGSLLFWALMVALCGLIFQFTPSYKTLERETRLWYWVFYLSIMAFFALLLTAWSNPFLQISPTPPDGRGMNPMLQNPGMIIHPPLLFLGYGGFVIPGCLALAQAMHRGESEASWLDVARPFTLTAWLFLTAGIVIGGWWAYMELGWGGYWAWDPVENASLIPWLLGTAAIHTGLLQTRRDKLLRVNTFLMALTTVSAFFATYLVRGNVVQSVHVFGEGGVGPALLFFVLGSFVVVLLAALRPVREGAEALGGLETREGFLVLTAWMLVAISLVILVATLWPVITETFGKTSSGLSQGFYNRVCLPLFTVVMALLALCPWLGWKGGLRSWPKAGGVAGVFVISLAGLWLSGVRDALPLMAASLSIAALASMVLVIAEKSTRTNGPSLGAALTHFGLGLIALGIAFSGPYASSREVTLAKGESVEIGPYTATLDELYEGSSPNGAYDFLEAEIRLTRNGDNVAVVSPQYRVYSRFNQNSFEAATHPSLGTEFYATLLGLENGNKAVIHVSAHPLVNWLWIGGTIMTLAPLLGLRRRFSRKSSDDSSGRA